MTRYFTLILTFCFLAAVVPMKSADAALPEEKQEVIHVATALNHLSLLEFQEPVTLVAAGGSDFQIERHDNKVFVKPLKSGVSTNLFVWTASRRFNYELEPAGEVQGMNLAIDNTVSTPKPVMASQPELDQVADVMLTRVFLGSEAVDSSSISIPRKGVIVRIEQVLRTKNSLYLHYTVENRTTESYHVTAPTAYEIVVGHSPISLPGLQRRQLDQQTVRKFRETRKVVLPIAHAEAKPEDLSPAQRSSGVIAIRQDLASPSVLQIVFGGGIEAVVVL